VKFPDSDLLSAFGEAIVTVDASRCITACLGDIETILGVPSGIVLASRWHEFLATHVMPDVADSLYWVVEAIFEGYVPPQYLPYQSPFKPNYISHIAVLPEHQIAIRIRPTHVDETDQFIHKMMRPALTSTVGFADVLLKGIGGPLTDIQLEDLNVISRDGQFALELLEDLRAHYLLPGMIGLVPITIRDLLNLGPDDIPRRRLASQRLTVEYDLPDEAIVYSNGALRWATMSLVRQLTQLALHQSKIVINAQPRDDVLEVGVMYQPADTAMQAEHRVEPATGPNRRQIKQADRLLSIISSLHMQLASYGCTAWAVPTQHSGASMIVMTVPLWHGPLSRPQ